MDFDCDLIRDLLPLYLDGVCSDASRRAVKAHLAGCADCRRALAEMEARLDLPLAAPPPEGTVLANIRRRWANSLLTAILLTALLFTAAGVMVEGGWHTLPQGQAALWLVVPGVSFFLSLIHYFFAREYRSAPLFAAVSGGLTALLCLGGDALALWYYRGWGQGGGGLFSCLLIALATGGVQLLLALLYGRWLGLAPRGKRG